MTSSGRLDVRFAVGSAEGPNSVSVKIVSSRTKADVYAMIREIAEAVKISLHKDGHCFSGLQEPMKSREPELVARLGGSRFQHVWTRRTHLGSQECGALHFCFPSSQLRSWRRSQGNLGDCLWLPVPAEGRSQVVTVYYTGSLRATDNWPRREHGSHLLQAAVLANGEKVWVVAEERPTSAIELKAVSEAARRKYEEPPIPFTTDLSASEIGPRTIAFASIPGFEGYAVVDIADDDPRAAL